jgi:hypothetical protein
MDRMPGQKISFRKIDLLSPMNGYDRSPDP